MVIPIIKDNETHNVFPLLVISLLLGLIASYFHIFLTSLILFVAVFLLFRNSSEFFISAMIISTLIFDEVMIQKLGIPSIGLNLLDFFVAFLLSVVVYKVLKTKEIRINTPLFCLMILFILGSFSLFYGVQSGFPLRGALRDYRTFVYLLVVYWVIYLDFQGKRKIGFVLSVFYLFVFVQFLLIALGRLVVNPVMREYPTYIMGAGANLSAWHFVAGYSYFPMLISVALLKNSYRSLKPWLRLSLLLTIFISLIVMIASFNRSIYTIIPIIIFWMMTRDIKKRVTLRRNFYILLGIIFVFSFVIFIAKFQGKDDFYAALLDRVFYLKDTGENSVHGRLIDAQLTSEYIIKSPLTGYGLGSDFAPPQLTAVHRRLAVSGTGMHMGYLWLAYRAGIPALLLFMYILWNAFNKGRRFLRLSPRDSIYRGLMMGLQGCLMLSTLGAFFSTSLVFFKELPYWGLIIGLIHSLNNLREAQFV
jgi:hypothetical protein